MTRRMIDSSMWENEKFGALPMGAKLLQVGMINHADDQGRVKAHPVYLSKAIFPYDEDVSVADIRKWLELLHANGTILLYVNDEKQYAQLTNWWKYQSLQYAQPSDYPRPEGWQDRIRRTLTKGQIVTCNWFKVNGDPIPNTCDMDGNAIGSNGAGYRPPPRDPQNSPPPPDSVPAQPRDQPHGDSGDDSGECSPDDTTYSFNLTELNLTQGESIDPVSTARASADRSAESPPTNFDPEPLRKPGWSGKQDTGHRLHAKPQTHFDPRKLVGGFIPKGTGENGTEVYFEFHAFDRRSPPSKTAMEQMNEVADLERWRQVLEKCSLAGWKPGNIGDRLDAFKNGFRHEQKAQAQAPPAKIEYAIAGML